MSDISNFLSKCSFMDKEELSPIISAYPDALEEMFSREMIQEAQDTISNWEGYQPTPLLSLDSLAQEIGVGELFYKDESTRFGLGSFKALGGAYAVEKLMQGENPAEITVATATDGNHGRSVAWGAQKIGCKCVIYIHKEVSQGRADAMAAFGAEIIRVDGDYDDSVRACSKDAAEHGYKIISDTSWEGYMDTPRFVMSGYSMMVREILEQMDEPPTHVIMQAGVGGFASAIIVALWQKLGDKLPDITIAESGYAPCIIASMRAGVPTAVDITQETMMAGLSCGDASPVAYEVMKRSASRVLNLDDAAVPEGMRMMASGQAGEKIIAGECAVPGIIALAAMMKDDATREAAKLDENSRVLVFGCEGATDEEIYNDVISGKVA